MKLIELLIRYFLIEDLTDDTEDIDGRDDDRRTSDDRADTTEGILVLEGSDEDIHLGHEPGEARKTEVGQTGDDITAREERDDLHQTAEVTDVTRAGTVIDHTDAGEEEGRHQTVREHLQDSTRDGRLRHHQQGEEHHTTVTHGRVGVDIFQVSLYTGREGTVDDGAGREDQEDPAELLSGLGEQEHGDTEATVTTELHQHTEA